MCYNFFLKKQGYWHCIFAELMDKSHVNCLNVSNSFFSIQQNLSGTECYAYKLQSWLKLTVFFVHICLFAYGIQKVLWTMNMWYIKVNGLDFDVSPWRFELLDISEVRLLRRRYLFYVRLLDYSILLKARHVELIDE